MEYLFCVFEWCNKCKINAWPHYFEHQIYYWFYGNQAEELSFLFLLCGSSITLGYVSDYTAIALELHFAVTWHLSSITQQYMLGWP